MSRPWAEKSITTQGLPLKGPLKVTKRVFSHVLDISVVVGKFALAADLITASKSTQGSSLAEAGKGNNCGGTGKNKEDLVDKHASRREEQGGN